MLQLSIFLENRDFNSIYAVVEIHNRDVSGKDVGNIPNLGARHFESILFLRKGGILYNMKRVLLCLLQSLGGHLPPVPIPVPPSIVSCQDNVEREFENLTSKIRKWTFFVRNLGWGLIYTYF